MKKIERLLVGFLGVGFVVTMSLYWRGAGMSIQQPQDNEDSINHFSITEKQTPPIAPKNGDVFVPGTLDMSRLETFHRCHVDPTKYKHHFNKKGGVKCSISDKYGLIYYMVAKAGSSTCRYVMKNSLEGKEQNCALNNQQPLSKDMFHFTFFREPTLRFFSAYQEAFHRTRRFPKRIPKKYRKFMKPFFDISRQDYRFLLESNATQQIMQLTNAFTQFVNDYDAQEPFDGHLRLQIPRLTHSKTGIPIKLNATFDSTQMQESFQQIARDVKKTEPITVIHAYDRGTKRMDFSSIPDKTRRKICQLSAIDYCCLNYKLPPECQNVVTCRWIQKPQLSEELLIEPVSPYPP